MILGRKAIRGAYERARRAFCAARGVTRRARSCPTPGGPRDLLLRAGGRHVEVDSRRSVFCSGPLDLRAQAKVVSALRPDTPPSVVAAAERLSPSARERAPRAGWWDIVGGSNPSRAVGKRPVTLARKSLISCVHGPSTRPGPPGPLRPILSWSPRESRTGDLPVRIVGFVRGIYLAKDIQAVGSLGQAEAAVSARGLVNPAGGRAVAW